MFAAAAAATVPAIPQAAQFFGWTAGSIGIVVGWPQAWRLWVGRRHAGLSLSSNVLAVLYSTAWFLYGVASHRVVQTVTGFVGLCVAAAVLAGHLRLGRPATRAWLPGWIAGTLLLGMLFAIGRGPLGLTASVATISGVLPQLVTLARARRRGRYDVGGVSVARWVLSSGCNVLWVCYGVLVRDPLIVANSTIIASIGVVIVVLTTRSARQELLALEAAGLVPAQLAAATIARAESALSCA